MDTESRRNLQILEEISKNGSLTQRGLSKKLGIALGLTNLYLKRLAKKGHIKIKGIPGKRYLYYLTPKGFTEKTSLTYKYIQNSYLFYKDAKDRVKMCFEDLAAQNCKNVVFYPANEIAEIAYLCLQGTNINLVGVVADRQDIGSFNGHQILHVEKLKDLEFDKIIITSMEPGFSISEFLKKSGVVEERICLLR